jgi:hypothetical protein
MDNFFKIKNKAMEKYISKILHIMLDSLKMIISMDMDIIFMLTNLNVKQILRMDNLMVLKNITTTIIIF